MIIAADSRSQPAGKTIEKVLQNVDAVAELHAVLTSPRHQYCRRRFLQALRTPMTLEELDQLRKELGVSEYQRHINKLARNELVEPVKSDREVAAYVRTPLGEEALNHVSELERKIGADRARIIAEGALGPNAIRLFLTIFGNNRESDLAVREIVYTPLEIGQLLRVFSRTVDGISAIDKLDDGGLISYLEDGNIHLNPRRSTAFYNYLRNLYHLLVKASALREGQPVDEGSPRPDAAIRPG
jgi:hypothetical protein